MPLTPEQQAREKIDEQLEACGWVVQDFTSMDIRKCWPLRSWKTYRLRSERSGPSAKSLSRPRGVT